METKLPHTPADNFTFCALIFFFVRDEVQDFIIEQQLETQSDAENAGLTCIQKLEKKGVEFVELQKFGKPKCIVKEPVRIENYPTTKLSSPVTLNCSTALNLANWLEEIGASEVEHFGSYNCRTIRGSSIMSQHSYGSAIDIASINGASVLFDWANSAEKSEFLKHAGKTACNHFSNVLTPDYNQAHKDHFHLDDGYFSACEKPTDTKLTTALKKLVRHIF
ncbi:MAG: extensin family protein [Paracoccaceae bacterium]